MRLVGRIFSLLLALITTLLFVLAACNMAVENTFLNQETYADVLADDAFFEELLPVGLPAIINASESAQIDSEFGSITDADPSPVRITEIAQAIDEDALHQVAELVLPASWMQEQATLFIQTFLLIADGNLDTLDETVDLTDIRQRLTSDNAVEASTIIINNAPLCTEDQVRQIRTLISEGIGSLPICNPEDDAMHEASVAVIQTWLAAIADQLGPDTVTVSELYDIEYDTARVINLMVEIDRKGLLLTYLCPMGLLALIVAFSVRSLRGFGRWMGSVSVATGVIILLLIFTLQFAVIGILGELLSTNTEFDVLMARFVSAMLRSIFAQSSSRLLVQAALFMFIGFGLLAMTWLVGQKTSDHTVFITQDGQVISTATRKRIGTVTIPNDATLIEK